MAFVYCHVCGWSQDDFWSTSYNSLEGGGMLKRCVEMMREGISGTKRWIEMDAGWARENPGVGEPLPEGGVRVYYRDMVVRELRHTIDSIAGMHWETEKQWNEDPSKWNCPKCGVRAIHVD